MPYWEIQNNWEVVERVKQGYRLPRPEICPLELWDIVRQVTTFMMFVANSKSAGMLTRQCAQILMLLCLY